MWKIKNSKKKFKKIMEQQGRKERGNLEKDAVKILHEKSSKNNIVE